MAVEMVFRCFMTFNNFYRKVIFKSKILFVPCDDNNYRPRFLDSDFLFYCVVILLVLKIFAFIFLVNFPKSVFFADITKTVLINLVNRERADLGLQPLKENEKLNQGAFLKAQDMMEKDYFSHQSPEGVSPWHWFSKSGYNYQNAGENLAIGFLDSEEVYRAWLNSASHRNNLLNPTYKEVGIAILKGDFLGKETIAVVQFLGAPQSISALPEKERKETPKPIEKNQKEPEGQAAEKKQEIPEKGKVISQSEEISFPLVKLTTKEKIRSSVLSFLSFTFNNLLEIISYVMMFMVSLALLLNILIKFNIQRKDLIFRAVILIILLVSSSFFSKELVIEIFPHNLLI